MWVFLTCGFFSAVRDGVGLKVRARRRSHLRRLVSRHSFLAGRSIWETTGRDYRWRIFVTHDEWSRVMSSESRGIDYDNFKSAAG